MRLRVVLIVSGIIAILLGAFLFLAPDSAVTSFQLGTSDVASRLFARGFGGTLMVVGFVNLMASSDQGSPALRALVLGNLLIHIAAIVTDFTETFPASAGWWAGFIVHIALILAFGYYLLNWPQAVPAR